MLSCFRSAIKNQIAIMDSDFFHFTVHVHPNFQVPVFNYISKKRILLQVIGFQRFLSWQNAVRFLSEKVDYPLNSKAAKPTSEHQKIIWKSKSDFLLNPNNFSKINSFQREKSASSFLNYLFKIHVHLTGYRWVSSVQLASIATVVIFLLSNLS